MLSLSLEHLKTLAFGEKLKYLRFINKMSQQAVADKLFVKTMDGERKKVSQPTYNRIENQTNTRGVTIDFINQLEEVFQLPKGTLIDAKFDFEHLPQHLIDFVCNPENLHIIEDAYIKAEYEKRNIKSD